MFHPDDENRTPPLTEAVVTARMNPWLLIEAFDEACLFGFAEEHPATGGLSWVRSTPVIEFNAAADRARTSSGRIYSLGRRVLTTDLDEEGYVALRLLSSAEDYPGRAFDIVWVTTQKMARHLKLRAPQRNDPIAVERFLRRHLESYLALRSR